MNKKDSVSKQGLRRPRAPGTSVKGWRNSEENDKPRNQLFPTTHCFLHISNILSAHSFVFSMSFSSEINTGRDRGSNARESPECLVSVCHRKSIKKASSVRFTQKWESEEEKETTRKKRWKINTDVQKIWIAKPITSSLLTFANFGRNHLGWLCVFVSCSSTSHFHFWFN